METTSTLNSTTMIEDFRLRLPTYSFINDEEQLIYQFMPALLGAQVASLLCMDLNGNVVNQLTYSLHMNNSTPVLVIDDVTYKIVSSIESPVTELLFEDEKGKFVALNLQRAVAE